MSYKFKQTTLNSHFQNVFDVDPSEVLQNKSNLKLIDVRESSEYIGELGHIEGSELVVLNTIPDRLHTLSKSDTIVFICRSGGRSAQASAFALSKGFSEIYNMRGGMIAWNQQQLPIKNTI